MEKLCQVEILNARHFLDKITGARIYSFWVDIYSVDCAYCYIPSARIDRLIPIRNIYRRPVSVISCTIGR